MPKNAVIYCRVSTKDQEEKSSLNTQVTACVSLAESQGMSIGRIIREVYTGAELYDRPLLSEARTQIKAKQYDTLISYSVDRLSRNPIHLAIVAEEIERAGAELIFVTEPLDNSPEGALIRYVKGYAAQIEREKTRERCIRGKRAVALSGRIHRSGTELYGYRRNKEAGARDIYEPEADIVRRIYMMILNGESIRSIPALLNREGIPSPAIGKRIYSDGRAPRWGHGAVIRILNEPAYKGEAIAWKWKSYKEVSRHSRTITLRPDSERIRLPDGLVPPIISSDLWAQAQKRLRTNRGEKARNQNRQYLLRGRIFCDACGCRMLAEPCKNSRRYRCSSRYRLGVHCGGASVPADKVERDVWGQLVKRMDDPKIVERELRQHEKEKGAGSLKADLNRLEKQIARLDAEQKRLVDRYIEAEEAAIRKQIESKIKTIENEKHRITGDIEQTQKAIQTQSKMSFDMRSVLQWCRVWAKRIVGFDFEGKRDMLAAWGVRVIANGHVWQVLYSPSSPDGDMTQSLKYLDHNASPLRFKRRVA